MDKEKKVTGVECRHVQWIPSDPNVNREDSHLIKANVHYDDGSTEPATKLVKNYQRDFYVTKDTARGHKQKKEREHEDNLFKFECTQSELRNSVASALDMSWARGGLRQLANSPYLYGTDTSSSALIKSDIKAKNPDLYTPHSVCCYDTENNVLTDDRLITIASVAMDRKVHVSVYRDFLGGIVNPDQVLKDALHKYLGKYVKDGLEVVFDVVDTELEVIRNPVEVAKKWNPDILAIWNINHDLPLVEERLQGTGLSPKDLWSVNNIPQNTKLYKYTEGPSKRTTVSGVVNSLSMEQQWHSVDSTAPWTFLDAMCVFRELRSQEANRVSFSLDAILYEILGERKLNFKEAEGLSKFEWHYFMQKNYPVEYVIYNVFDSFGMVLLDEATNDLSTKVPLSMDNTEMKFLPRRTRRMDDMYYFYCKPKGYISGSVPADPPENKVLSLKDWICTAPAYLIKDNGLKCIKWFKKLFSNIRVYVFDIDLVSSYPSLMRCLNVSKETTRLEVVDIKKVPQAVFRLQNINSMHGPTNATSYCSEIYNYPTPMEVIQLLEEEMNNEKQVSERIPIGIQ